MCARWFREFPGEEGDVVLSRRCSGSKVATAYRRGRFQSCSVLKGHVPGPVLGQVVCSGRGPTSRPVTPGEGDGETMSANASPLFLCLLLPVVSQSLCNTARHATLWGMPAGDIQSLLGLSRTPLGAHPAPVLGGVPHTPPLAPVTHRHIESAPLSPGIAGGDPRLEAPAEA